MPRYYFLVTNDRQVLRHKDIKLHNNGIALAVGTDLARSLQYDKPMRNFDWHGWFVDVFDQIDRHVERISIPDVQP